VARISELARPALLRELLLLELDYRRRRGETPDPVEYRARFPDCLADIEAAFAPVPRREQPVPATVAVAELGPVASRCSPPDRIGLRPARRSPPAPCRWQPGLATTRRRPPRAPPLPTGPVPVAARFGNHGAPPAPRAAAPHRPRAGGSQVWQPRGVARPARRRSPPAPSRWQPGLATTRRRPPRAPPLPTGPVPVAARFGNHSPRP
jgi:hypothetical protein